MNKITMRGVAGEVRWGYQPVAAVGSWEMTAEPCGSNLSAEIQSMNASRMERQPLTFRAMRQNGQPFGEWPIESSHIAGSTLHARLGPQKA